MRIVKLLVFVFLLLFFLLVAKFVYDAAAHSKNVPADVQNSPDYLIALRNAERVRFVEFGVAAVLFPIVAFALAFIKLPSLSWLRSILSGLSVFLAVFVAFSKEMESTFQLTFPTAPLPLTALQTASAYPAAGIIFMALVFFVTERIHCWRVAR